MLISVGIVEDDPEIRTGLQKYLNSQPEFVCSIAEESVENFLKNTSSSQPLDVLLLDIGLPGMSGIHGIPKIKDRFPEIEIAMLTVYDDSEKIFQSLCAGASGYILKATPLKKIKEFIIDLYQGGSPMSPQIARKVVEYFHPSPRKYQPSVLTPREKEIVNGLVNGLSYKMIAAEMGISIETVRHHIKSIYRKLHVNSKAEVISKSFRGEI